MRFQYISKAIIKRDDNKILAVRRNMKNPRSPGKWTIPGGHLEKGESFEECCIREVLEETNLEVFPKKAIHTKIVEGREGDLQLIHVIFETECENLDNITLSDEHIDYKWVNINDIQY